MKNLSIAVIVISLIFFGCRKNLSDAYVQDTGKKTALTQEQILSSITYENKNNSVEKVLSVTDYEQPDSKLISIVKYIDNGNIEKIVAIQSDFKNGKYLPNVRMTCEGCGDGGCQFRGPITDYMECAGCPSCYMKIVILEKSSNKAETSLKANFSELAKKSYIRTFGKNTKEIKVKTADYREIKDIGYVINIEYVGDNGLSSTFMVVVPDKANSLNVSGKLYDGPITIDCTGECGCVERWVFGKGPECTCNPCKMVVTEVS